MATNMDADSTIAMAEKLFPEYFKLQQMEIDMGKLKWERASVADPKFQNTNAFVLKVVETNQLRCVILDFECEQANRVKTIIQQQEDALARVQEASEAKAAKRLVKGMPLIGEHSFMRWEVDTDAGDTNELKDELDDVILKTEKELDQLQDRFTFEAMMHNTLVFAMEDFLSIAQLPKHEAKLWVPRNSDNVNYKVFRSIEKSELKHCKAEAFAWMGATAIHYLKLKKQDGAQTHAPGGGTSSTGPASGSHDKATTACSQGRQDIVSHDEASAIPHIQADLQPNFCTFYQKWGHIHQHCREMYPEENKLDYCMTCDRDGHNEETCWVLHPHLRQRWLAERKVK